MIVDDPTGPMVVPFDDTSACEVLMEPRPARSTDGQVFVTPQVHTRHSVAM